MLEIQSAHYVNLITPLPFAFCSIATTEFSFGQLFFLLSLESRIAHILRFIQYSQFYFYACVYLYYSSFSINYIFRLFFFLSFTCYRSLDHFLFFLLPRLPFHFRRKTHRFTTFCIWLSLLSYRSTFQTFFFLIYVHIPYTYCKHCMSKEARSKPHSRR